MTLMKRYYMIRIIWSHDADNKLLFLNLRQFPDMCFRMYPQILWDSECLWRFLLVGDNTLLLYVMLPAIVASDHIVWKNHLPILDSLPHPFWTPVVCFFLVLVNSHKMYSLFNTLILIVPTQYSLKNCVILLRALPCMVYCPGMKASRTL